MTSSSREIILASSFNSPIAAYDPLNGNMLARFSSSRSPRSGLALVKNNLIAASHISPDTASSGFIHLYNWWSSAAFRCIHVPEPVAPIVATPDGSYLFSGSLTGFVHILSLPSGDLCRSFQAHRQPVSCLAINEDGSLLISGSEDGMITVFPILRLLDVSSSAPDSDQLVLNQFAIHSSTVTSLALQPGGCNSSMVSTSLDGTCKFWNITDGAHLQTIQLPGPVWSCTVDATNSWAYVGGSDGLVRAIPMKRTGRHQRVEEVVWGAEQTGAVVAMAMVNGDKNLVSASEEGIIRLWEVESGSIVQAFGHETGGMVSDLLVVKGFGNGQVKDLAANCNGSSGSSSGGFSERQMHRKVREEEEMEEQLGMAAEDRRRAIGMLEASIETYQRLLELLLKEAKGDGDKEEEAK